MKPPRLEKVSSLLDNLEYDARHNREAFPQSAQEQLASALPLAKALCDVLVPLETILERRRTPLSHDSDGVRLLDKLRWDLRVASGAELGNHDKRHLAKHEALYAAVKSLAAPASDAARGRDVKPQCVRSRLYFSHNSQLSGLLHLLLQGLDSKATQAQPTGSPPDFSPGASAKASVSSFGSDNSPGPSGRMALPKPEVRDLYAQRLGFLSHFIVRLWRKRSDGSLRVTCDASPSGSFRERVQLFDLPFAEVDTQWSNVLEPAELPSA